MHALISVLTVGRPGRFAARLVGVLFLVMAVASPAMAQEMPSGGRSGGLLNVLLLAGIAFFLVRSFRRRGRKDDTRPGRWTPTDADDASGDAGEPSEPVSMDRHEAARRTWDILRSDTEERPVSTTPTGVSPDVSGKDFDEVEFLEGAKLFFARFLQAGDEGDFTAIRDFISDDVFNEAMAAGGGDRTEVMLLNARLMELKSEGGRTLATVFYDAQLRTGEQGERTAHSRQVWEFSRDDGKAGALWVLEKIDRVNQ
jgi:predicted lipid-binding transport protein (Tim44 family)